MKGDRLRVPVDQDYLAAIGRATYCFARLEWVAVYCGNKLKSGYVNCVAKKTAGQVSKDIKRFASRSTDNSKRVRYEAAVDEFDRLVCRRNGLMHANPGTAGIDQRLFRHGAPWQPSDIDDLADEFAACENELNELFHKIL